MMPEKRNHLLAGTVSEERMEEALKAILFLEAWEYVEGLRNLTARYTAEVDYTKEEEIERFISEHKVEMKEEKDAVSVSFVLSSQKLLPEISSQTVDPAIDIGGMVQFDKKSGEVLSFRYDLSGLFYAQLEANGKTKTNYHAEVREFVVEGRLLDKAPGDAAPVQDLAEYTAENKYEFINKFAEYVIPFYERGR